ncbi:O-antigen ligase family protein [Chloroflexota bacterium]
MAKSIKITKLLFWTEPIWVSITVSIVYLSVIFDWPAYTSWLFLTIAFAQFPLRLIRCGYPTRRTPFDIPIVLLIGGVVMGMVVSEHFDISLGAFQTSLAMTAFYYSVVNYSKPFWLIHVGMLLAVVGTFIASIVAINWANAGVDVPHGIGIALVLIGAIIISAYIFARQIIFRVASVVFGLFLFGVAIFLTHEAINRLSNLVSIKTRLPIWSSVINPIEGSDVWTGLGLGCWPLIPDQSNTLEHVHNAYLELYINTGILGLVSLFCALAIGAKIAFDIIYSPRNGLSYGFGIGVLLAILIALAVSFVESACFGFGFFYGEKEVYRYLLMPIPWILAGSLVIARNLLWEECATDDSQ